MRSCLWEATLRSTFWWVLAWLGLSAAGLGAQGVVGEWRLMLRGGVTVGDLVDEYREDGSYSGAGWVNVFGQVFRLEVEGRWERGEGTFSVLIDETNDPQFFPVGSRFDYEVLEISENRLVYRDGFGDYTELRLGAGPPVEADSDGDGMGDTFELLFFGSATGAEAGEDVDGDGWSNVEEAAAGTSPLHGESRPEVVLVSDGAVVSAVVGDPAPHRRYRLMRLGAGGGFELVTEVGSNAPAEELKLPTAGEGVYRVEIVDETVLAR